MYLHLNVAAHLYDLFKLFIHETTINTFARENFERKNK